MRLPAAVLVLWMALIGAIAPVLACASPHASMDCCPPDAPTDCRIAWTFERADTTTIAVTQAPSIEFFALPPVSCHFAEAASSESFLTLAPASEFLSDATLTYLRTGRLRL